GTRNASGRRLREGTGLRTRDRHTCAPGRRSRSGVDHRLHTRPAQRLPAAEAAEDVAVARYTDADCKLCRREGMKLYLKGTKCETPKCPVEKRPFPPGQHGRGRRRDSEYQLRLREKQ